MRSSITAAALIFSVCVTLSSAVLELEWSDFKHKHGKTYSCQKEEATRQQIFVDNTNFVAQHNSLASQNLATYTMAINHLGDLLSSEVHSSMFGLVPMNATAVRSSLPLYDHLSSRAAPASMDWRTKGAVTPVKNQGQCGSCWTFATTGAVEALNFQKTGKLVPLSEQNLVDCASNSKYPPNGGCGGGWPASAVKYISDNGGIDTEASYPYTGAQGSCRYNAANKGGTASSSAMSSPSGDENALMNMVGNQGPAAIAIDASAQSFQFYHSGVYSDARCSSKSVNHAVLAVGYGNDAASKKDYWIVKNSWGTTWGNQGYINIARNDHNMCGVASYAMVPV